MDENDSSPSFLDIFSVHLAESLIGTTSLIQTFQNSLSPTFYWRTQLLNRSDIPDERPRPPFQSVFLDVTISFLREEGKPCSQVEFGTLLLSAEESNLLYYYVKSAPLTLSNLREHAEAIGIEMDATAPKAIATSMGGALLALTALFPSDVSVIDGAIMAARLPIFYSDLEETGSLNIVTSTASKLEASTAFMMLHNFSQHDILRGNEVKVEQGGDVAIAFHKWWSLPRPSQAGDETHTRPKTISIENKRSEPTIMKAGYSRLVKKRRKPEKLSYSKAP